MSITVQDWLGADNKIGIDIWEKKYRHENESFDEWLDRVSGGDEDIRRLIIEKKFLFAGRILAGRGAFSRQNKVCTSNCYVCQPPEDSLESIYDCARDMARTYSYGGGCGVDISGLAPKGATIHNAAKQTSGAVSFMELFAMSTALIGQHGRRGALMISIDGKHPDLPDFIDAKRDLNKLTKANTSIRVHDDFMEAVERGAPYRLHYTREATGERINRVIDARETFHRIAENNWLMGEPGVLFWDTVEDWNLLSEDSDYEYAGVNPCAEEPLPANGACLLGSLNLSEFVKTGDDGKPYFDMKDFSEAVRAAVRALNRVLDEGLDAHPLPQQAAQARKWRQIGLGVFGVADMCIKLELPYGYGESLHICDKIAHTMINEALRQSALLARDEGYYPAYDARAVTESEFFNANADEETKCLVRQYGLRNSQLLTIPPTGTTSTMLGVSNGIEPIFAVSYTRKTESVHDRDVYYKTFTPSVERYMREHGITREEDLPEFITLSTSGKLDYHCRINMQATWQRCVDASISSTVNLPESATVEDVEHVYMAAWKHHLKGVTVFRDNCARAGILTTGDPAKQAQSAPEPREIPGTLAGTTTRARIPCGELHITCNRDEQGPCQLIVTPGRTGGCRAQSTALANMVTLALRSGIRPELIAQQLKGMRCPAAAGKRDIDAISCPDAIGRALERFTGGDDDDKPAAHTATPEPEQAQAEAADVCPVCHTPFTHEGGCVTCHTCGYSRCG